MYRIVTVDSPYAPQSKVPARAAVELARNLAYVRAAMADCFARDEVPFASHALYTQPGVLDDTVPEQREQGINAMYCISHAIFVAAGKHPDWFSAAHAFYIDRGWSTGMVDALEEDAKDGEPCLRRTLGEQWSKEHDAEYYLDDKGELRRYDEAIAEVFEAPPVFNYPPTPVMYGVPHQMPLAEKVAKDTSLINVLRDFNEGEVK